MKLIEELIFRNVAPQAIRHLAKPDLGTREPLLRRVLDQAAREFQLAPPLTVHSVDPELMAGLWHATREAYVVGAADRAMREAVAAAVSKLNECPYCVTVHAGLYAAAARDARALVSSDSLPSDIASARAWAMATLSPETIALRNPALSVAAVPQIFGTAMIYHYINRLVSVFLADTPVALPGMNSGVGRTIMHRAFAVIGKSMVAHDPMPGQCAVLREAALPPEFAWASANPVMARALAHFAWSAERAGGEAIPASVRSAVERHLASWRGEQPPMSRAWMEDIVAALDKVYWPSARLALLAARAPYQVDDRTIAEFRACAPGDKPLLQTVAWASFAATKRIASWFPVASVVATEGAA